MSDSISLKQLPKQVQSLKQKQQIMLTANMQQAIKMLQTPVLELLEVIEAEVEQNPLLDYDEIVPLPPEETDPETVESSREEKELQMNEEDFSAFEAMKEDYRDFFDETLNGQMRRCSQEDEEKHSYQMSLICYEPTLHEDLLQQVSEATDDPQLKKVAYTLIGYMDQQGYIDTSLSEIAAMHSYSESELAQMLKLIQSFEPAGVGARDLQEALLIQLKRQKKEHGLAYTLILECFEEVLRNRIPEVAKKLKVSTYELYQAIHTDLLPLNFHPGNAFNHEAATPIIPDLVIEKDGNQLIVEANRSDLPVVRLKKEYVDLLKEKTMGSYDKDFILQKFMAAKWFIRNLHQRGHTLERIGEHIARNQRNFFIKPGGELAPMTMKSVAEELGLHESTISRAVANKYMYTPKGMYPLVYFFSQGLVRDSGEEVASNAAKELLLRIIAKEDKRAPFSDEALVKEMAQRGIQCARRTIAKYRAMLKVGNRQQRRQYR